VPTKSTVRARALNPTDPINELIFFGQTIKPDVVDNLMSSTIDGSMDMVTQISLNIFDPGFQRLNSGIYEPKIPVRLNGYMFQVSNVELGETNGHESISVKARPRAVALLKARVGKKIYKNLSPSEFVERECKAVGITAICQKSGNRKQIKRDTKSPDEKGTSLRPSSWTTFQRLASECGFVCFEWGNVVYFGKPTWLLDQAKDSAFHIHWGSDAPTGSWIPFSVPRCQKSDETKIVTMEIDVPISAWKEIRVGGALKLSGIFGFNGTYLIDSVNFPLVGASTITVTAKTPENPPKVKPVKMGSGSAGGDDELWTGPGGTEPQTGTGSVSAFVGRCLSQSGDTYIFGAETNLADPDPSAFDCSELIEWACAQVGVYMPDGSSAQIGYAQSKGQGLSVSAGIATYGAILYKPGHIAVSLGNGETIEAVGTGYGVRKMSATNRSFSWTAAARIPGMRY
jgi:cell wall-associated NlpC family hydrolase